MVKPIYYSLIFILLFAVISSCEAQNQSGQDKDFLEMFPLVEMNTKIQFWDPNRMIQTPRIGETLNLSLENFSQYKIVFPSDFGLRIFTFNDQSMSWDEIGNNANYFPTGNRQISPKGTDLPGVILIGLQPTVLNEGKPVDVRVIVVGRVAQNGTPTNEQVGAWVDVTLQP